jgi:hypothetical protein
MPKFPVIWLGANCGVMHFNNIDKLNTTDLMFFGPLVFETDLIVDSVGQEWVLRLNSKTKISLSERLKAMFGSCVKVKVDYGFIKSQQYELDQLKAKLVEQSKNDSGDLMWQFIEHDEIVSGVNSSSSIPALLQFIESKVCNET